MNANKPGWKTSEFYVVAVGLAGVLWQFVQTKCGGFSNDDLLALFGLVVTYVGSRTVVKLNAPQTPPLTPLP